MEVIMTSTQILTLNVGAVMIGIGASLIAAGLVFEWVWRKMHLSPPDDVARR